MHSLHEDGGACPHSSRVVCLGLQTEVLADQGEEVDPALGVLGAEFALEELDEERLAVGAQVVVPGAVRAALLAVEDGVLALLLDEALQQGGGEQVLGLDRAGGAGDRGNR